MSRAVDQRDLPRPLAVIVDREGLGDALLKLPMLRALWRGFPGRPIWWIATHQTAMADDLQPFVTTLIDRVMPFADITTPVREAIPRLRALPPFECVFDTRTRVASVLAAKLVLRHRGFFASLPAYAFSSRRPPGRWRRPRSIAARALSLAEAALGTADGHGTLDLSPKAQAAALARLPPGPRYVGIASGSREVRKNWPIERFIAVASALPARGLTPMFFTGPQEREQLEMLRRAVPTALFPQAQPLPEASGITSLEFAAALAQRLAAAVANDSGLGHLLGAVGTPLVSLFAPTDPQRWAPVAPQLTVLRAQEFGGETMEEIPIEAVLGALEVIARR
jgi:ADP-heptose:LPS heptosyltransferase